MIFPYIIHDRPEMKTFLKASLQLPATVFPCRTAINRLLQMLHWQTTILPNFHKLPYCHRLPQTVTLPDCHRLSQTAKDCHILSQTATDCHCRRLSLYQTATDCHCHSLSLYQTDTDCHIAKLPVFYRLLLSQTVTLPDCHRLSQTVTLPDCHRLSHCHSLPQTSSHIHKVPAREIIFQTNPLLNSHCTTVHTCSWLYRALKNCSETSHKLYSSELCILELTLNIMNCTHFYRTVQKCTENVHSCNELNRPVVFKV